MAPFVFLDPLMTQRRLAGYTYVPTSTSYRIRAVLTVFWLLVWMGLMAREALRREVSLRRTQCRTCLLGMAPAALGGIIAFLPAFNVISFPSFLGVLVAMLPVFVGLAVLRQEMFDIKIALRRTLPYAVTTGLIGVTYALVVAGVQHYGHLVGELPRGTELVALAIFVGLGFQPTLEALQSALDRAFFRSEAELDRYLAGASGRYGAAASAAEVAEMAVKDVRDTLQLEWAVIALGGDATGVQSSGPVPPSLRAAVPAVLASLPEGRRPIGLPVGEEGPDNEGSVPFSEALSGISCRLAVPFDVSGEQGLILCGEKRSHAPFSPRDLTFVAALAAQAEGAVARVRSRAEAQQLRELTGAVLASLANSVALVDEEGRVVTCNPIFRSTFGGDAGVNIADLGLSVLIGPVSLPVEVHTGGRVFIASGRRLEGDWGGPASVIVLTDVTELHRLQDEAGRRKALAKIGAAVASVSHEVMNVLAPVTIYLDVARRHCATEEATKALGSAQSRLAELTRLTDELRDYYREPRLSSIAIRLADAVASCLSDLKATAGGGWSPPGLGGLGVTLRADPQKLKQTLMNVLKNAWEAMAETDRKEWSVRSRVEDGRAFIEVRDTGTGLSAEEAGKAFEPFYSTKPRRGAGLGLAIAQRIAEAHGAKITIAGEPGSGATVTIAWPLADGA
jgi:signal transduction histidine kinase